MMYGTGLCILETLRLRVKDVDFQRREFHVRDGKGAKDRITVLPRVALRSLRAHLVRVGVPPKGIFGAGHTLTEPVPTPHWRPERAAAGAVQQRLWLRLEALHALPPITYDDLGIPPFARYRWGVRSSGVRIPSTLADHLEDLWEVRNAAAKVGRGG